MDKQMEKRVDLEEDDGQESEFTGATLALDADSDKSPSAPTNNHVQTLSSVEQGDTNANISRAAKSTATVVWQVPFFGRNLPDSKRFFADREGAFEKAVDMCRPVMLENLDGSFQGAWLLIEIDHWDNEKERFLVLAEKSLLVIKFDFITMNIIEYRRIDLRDLDCLIHGEIKYPEKSLMPKLSGAVGHVKGFMTTKLQRKNRANQAAGLSEPVNEPEGFFRGKHAKGIRCMWNKGRPVQFAKNWNPWSRDIPFITLAAHRLFYSEDVESKHHYDIETFTTSMINIVRSLNEINSDRLAYCMIKEEQIVIENYVGVLSVMHNAADLGFFKSRGRVSF